MLQLFRNAQLPTALLVLVYLLILSLNTWFYPHPLVEELDQLPSTLGQWLLHWVRSPAVNRFAFVGLVFIQALVLNAWVNQFRLAKKTTFVPAVAYVWMHFIGSTADICSPVVLGNCFVLWSLHQLWSSGEKRASLGTIFNIGFAAAMAALCYHGFVVLFLWIILGWLLIRTFDVQEFILLVGGFGVPFFLMGTYQFGRDNLGNWWQQEVLAHYTQWVPHFTQEPTWLISLGLLGLLLVVTLVQWGTIQFKTNAREKKAQQSVLLMALLMGLSFLVQSQLYLYHFLVFAVPFGVLYSLSLQAFQSRAWAEVLHLILLLAVIGLQYQAFFFQPS